MGISDANLAEKLQLDSKLTLETAIAKARESETVKKQQSVVRGENPQVDRVHHKKPSYSVPREKCQPQVQQKNTALDVGKAYHTQSKTALPKIKFASTVNERDTFAPNVE